MRQALEKPDRHPIINEVFMIYGTATKLANALGVSRQAVSAWKVIPLRHLQQVSHETGLAREKLRPDIYG